MTKEINTDKLIEKLGKNPKTFKVELAEILTVFDNQPKRSPGELALIERRNKLAHCKKEVGSLLMRAQKKHQLTDEIAKKTIDGFGLCALTKDKTPRTPTPYWLRRIVGQWIKEDKEKSA
jgi:hypothetical protein